MSTKKFHVINKGDASFQAPAKFIPEGFEAGELEESRLIFINLPEGQVLEEDLIKTLRGRRLIISGNHNYEGFKRLPRKIYV